jgi:hypothetical protein
MIHIYDIIESTLKFVQSDDRWSYTIVFSF